MPLKLSIGQSRKVSQDYNSRGYSINLDVELPADAAGDPATITTTAEQLYDLCDQLLERQIAGASNERPAQNGTGRRTYSRRKPTDHSNGNGRTNRSKRSGSQPRRLTNAQERAIHTMAGRLDQDADEWATHEFAVDGVTNLNVRQASQMIDALKSELEHHRAEVSR